MDWASRHPTTYETSFTIYFVNNCNQSSVKKVVSKKIKTCSFKPIPLQFWQEDPMFNSIESLFEVNKQNRICQTNLAVKM